MRIFKIRCCDITKGGGTKLGQVKIKGRKAGETCRHITITLSLGKSQLEILRAEGNNFLKGT